MKDLEMDLGLASHEKMPLLLLPGTLCDEQLWEPQSRNLSDLCEPIVMPVGNHPSTCAQVEEILRQAPQRFALAGLSYGGILALELMHQAPERVLGLALLDTNARPDPVENRQARYEQLRTAQECGLATLVRETLWPQYVHESRLFDQYLLQKVIDMAVSNGIGVLANQLQGVMTRRDSRPMLRHIACSTLVLCGEDDRLCPIDRHEEIANAIPQADLVVLPQCGHLSTLESPEEVTAAMRRWLLSI